MLLFTEGPHGLEPLWLWLNEQGLPFGVHSWEGVFRAANERCERVLTPPRRIGLDPHQVYAPYATPHSARHSFALYMLVVLNVLMDQKYGLTEEERREFRQLYGDPWFMVQQLLGHASRETTRGLVPRAGGRPEPAVDAGRGAGADRRADAGAGRGVRPGGAGVGGHPGPRRHRAGPGRGVA